MKYLTSLQLINWHYFENETIRLTGSTLLTGDNAAGKSTILDAIQYALVADSRRIRFNSSAHDETRRTLEGYLRGKLGRDNGSPGGAYLREGDFTTYVVLEFQDTHRRKPFLVGCAVDSYASGEYEPLFFKMEDHVLDDSLFLAGDRPLSARTEFRPAIRRLKGSIVYSTAEHYRDDLLAKFGHISPRFFTLLVKALAFHPITDVRQFVYDYVLDEHEINVEVMRDNLQQYRHYEALVRQTEGKIVALRTIRDAWEAWREVCERIDVQEAIVLLAERDGLQKERNDRRAERDRMLIAAEAARQELGGLSVQKEQQQALHSQLLTELGGHAVQQSIVRIEQDIARLQLQASAIERRAVELAAEVGATCETLAAALRPVADEAEAFLMSTGEAALSHLMAARIVFGPLLEGDYSPPPDHAGMERLAVASERVSERLRTAVIRDETQLVDRRGERERLKAELAELAARRLTYPTYVNDLRWLIFQEIGEDARVLCELLQIPDERWQDAVEGYLNTQRFDLIVAPAAFDAAIAVYERRKRERHLHSVGLVNTEAILREATPARSGSLAEAVVTTDPSARAYIDRLLGRVMRCDTEQELKLHTVAITATCMTYRHHTARQIPPEVYANWYVGERAFAHQRQAKEQRLAEVGVDIAVLDRRTGRGRQALKALDELPTLLRRVYAPGWTDATSLPPLLGEMEGRRRDLAALDTREVDALREQAEALAAAIRNLDMECQNQAGIEQASLARAQGVADLLASLDADLAGKEGEVQAFATARPTIAAQGDARYSEERRSREPAEIAAGFRANRLTHVSRANRLKADLDELRLRYVRAYEFGGSPLAGDNAVFAAELVKLEESELPAYAERIAAARSAAEQEFKEHFVFRLREHIEIAHQNLQQLNRVLSPIRFGADRYAFHVAASPAHRPAHDMIMDPLALEGSGLFDGAFRERHASTLDQLFDRILDRDPDVQASNIRELTDYRTYLDFDIRIHHDDGATTLFSRILRETSGGETQTPFYVAMAASFLQVYRPDNHDAIRLILFDEAFNRMDADRAENTLRFIRQVGLQVIAAAPTDKCEILSPHLESTLLVLREGLHAWLEPYHQVLLAAASEAEAAAARDEGPV